MYEGKNYVSACIYYEYAAAVIFLDYFVVRICFSCFLLSICIYLSLFFLSFPHRVCMLMFKNLCTHFNPTTTIVDVCVYTIVRCLVD